MRSFKEFKEFLEEGLISEDDDKKEDKKESKKDSEKKSEKKDEDKKEEKEIQINSDNAFATAAKTIYGKKEYLKNTKSSDVDEDDDKVKPMEYLFQFGKGGKYQVKFESVPGSPSWVGKTKGISSGDKEEQGKILSTIIDVLDQFSSATVDPNLESGDVDYIRMELSYSNDSQLENFKKMFSALNISGFSKKAKARENLQKYMLILSRS